MDKKKHVAILKEHRRRTDTKLKFEPVDLEEAQDTKRFALKPVVNGLPIGVGGNEKEVKQNAARNALRTLNLPGKENQTLTTRNATETQNVENNPSAPVQCKSKTKLNYVSCPSEYGQKSRVPAKSVSESGPEQNNVTLFVACDEEYPDQTEREVEEDEEAAKLVHQDTCGIEPIEVSCSAVHDDGAPSKSSPPLSLESCHTQSKNEKHPDMTHKRRPAANQSNFSQDSKEEVSEVLSESVSKRFTSDFDSIKPLGRGGFGCVYKGREKRVKKDFAIKIVPYKGNGRELQEVKVLYDLSHINIIRFYSYWIEDVGYELDETSADESWSTTQSSSSSASKYLYIQMELCGTKTLKDWITKKNNQSLRDSKRSKESLTIAQQIISGVEYIHSMKFIHRDLKPSNILLLGEVVKIGDFGLVTTENDNAGNVMERTVFKGTPSYMAPEQKSEKTYDCKVDIFPLGLIYFELLWKLSTGHDRATVWDDVRKQKLPCEFPRRFLDEYLVIKSMLEQRPEDRPEAKHLKTELEKIHNTQAKEQHDSRTV